jgi:proteasome lid subunit RPN8/RPN11
MTDYVFEAGAQPAPTKIRGPLDQVKLSWASGDCVNQWLKFFYVNDENEVVGSTVEYLHGLISLDVANILKKAAIFGDATTVDITYHLPGGMSQSRSEILVETYEKLMVAFEDLGMPVRTLIQVDFGELREYPPSRWGSDPTYDIVPQPALSGARRTEIREEIGIDILALRKYREMCPDLCLAPFPGVDTVRVELKKIRPAPMKKITQPGDVRDLLAEMEDYDRERMKVLYLDGAGQVIGVENISTGILNQALVHPREVLKGAVLANAASIIVVHNHPSGEVEPSSQDISIAAVLEASCNLMTIRCLDFVIIGGGGRYASFKELGYMGRGHSDTLDAILKFNKPAGVGEGDDACSVAYRAALKTMEKYCGTKSQ